MIGNSIVVALGRYLTVWGNFFSRYKIKEILIIPSLVHFIQPSPTIKHGRGLSKSIRSVVTHCGTNNINTSSSDEISLGVVTIARPISHCYPNIEVIVSGLLPRDIHWSMLRVKIKKTNTLSETLLRKIQQINFHMQDADWTFPDNSLNVELYYQNKYYLNLIENGNIKFSNLTIETLQDVLSPQPSSQLSSSCLSQL